MAKRRQKRAKNKLKHLQQAAVQRRQHLAQQASPQPTALSQNLALLSDREHTSPVATDQTSAAASNKKTTAAVKQPSTSMDASAAGVTRETIASTAHPTPKNQSQINADDGSSVVETATNTQTVAPNSAATHPDTEKSDSTATTSDPAPQAALLTQVKQLIRQQKLQLIPNSQLNSAALKTLVAALPLPLPENYQQILLKFGALYGFGYFFAGRSQTNVAADLIYLNQAAQHDFLTDAQKQQLLLFAASERHFLAFSYGRTAQPQIVRGTQQQITTIAPDLATLMKQLTT